MRLIKIGQGYYGHSYDSKHADWTNVGLRLYQRRRRWYNLKPTFGGRLVLARIPGNTRQWPNAGSLLVQRLRRWPSIDPTLAHCLVSAEMAHKCTWCVFAAIIGELPCKCVRANYLGQGRSVNLTIRRLLCQIRHASHLFWNEHRTNSKSQENKLMFN